MSLLQFGSANLEGLRKVKTVLKITQNLRKLLETEMWESRGVGNVNCEKAMKEIFS